VAASFQLNVDKGAELVCPQCGDPGEDAGLALSLTIGPVLDGMQVLLVQPGASLDSVLDDVRLTLVRDAIKAADGKQSAAAKQLGMKYTTFHALVKRLGLGPEGAEASA
jgi:DNA-binding NtrC family response regulator